MPADKLAIYNEALGHLGSRELASLAENRDPRRRLDRAWDNAVRYTLEQAPWSFAIRSAQVVPAPDLSPSFGYGVAYAKPLDWLKTVRIARDDQFRSPVLRYLDENGFWLTDAAPLFVRYVSTSEAYGLNVDFWTPSFVEYLGIRLAQLTCQRITGSSSMMADLVKLEKDARKRAKANDALNTAPVVPPVGSWVQARRSRSSCEEGSTGGGATSDPLFTADTTRIRADSDLAINTNILPII